MSCPLTRLASRIDRFVPSVGLLLRLIWAATVLIDASALAMIIVDPRTSLRIDFPRYFHLDLYPDASPLLLAAGCTLIASAVSVAARFYITAAKRTTWGRLSHLLAAILAAYSWTAMERYRTEKARGCTI